MCNDEFTDEDEKKREKLLKKAGFNSEMECDVGKSMSARSSQNSNFRDIGRTAVHPMSLPPEYLPPNSSDCKGDVMCGNAYCSFVDCTRG